MKLIPLVGSFRAVSLRPVEKLVKKDDTGGGRINRLRLKFGPFLVGFLLRCRELRLFSVDPDEPRLTRFAVKKALS